LAFSRQLFELKRVPTFI